MKSKILSFLTVGLCLLAFGCASFNANTYNAENLAADTARASTHAFNQYYQTATNGASPEQLAKLNGYRDQVYAADQQLSKTLATVEGLRLAYVENSADTNKTAVQIGIASLSEQSGNIVALVKSFISNPSTK